MEGDFPNRHFSATPGGSPPNYNAAQQAGASHGPAYQGTYAYRHDNASNTPSTVNRFSNSQAPPNYQHGYGQLGPSGPVYSSSSQGMSLYNNGAQQMFSQPNTGNGRSMSGPPAPIAHGNNELPGHRKRQEENGTRNVSEPKRAKRVSTEIEDLQKVGDRDLQTTQARYGPYSHVFSGPVPARIRVTMQQWTPPQDPRRATPNAPIEMLPYVIQVYDAMIDTSSGFFDKVNAANRILNGKYPAEQLEATAWLIVDEAVTLHRDGCRLLPFADPTYELKGIKACIHEDRQLFFKDRIEAICETFKVFKSACCEALDGAKTFKIVYGPTKIRERTRNNAISNDRRAKKARITSGGSINNDGPLHGDSEGVEDTSDVIVAAQKHGSLALVNPPFATQSPTSLADSQHVSPATGASPPNNMKPPQTPKKSAPTMYSGAPTYDGRATHASPPNPFLQEYIHYEYDPSKYSAGQFRSELEIQSNQSQTGPSEHQDDLVDLTGENLNPAPGGGDAANAWLRRSRDVDN